MKVSLLTTMVSTFIFLFVPHNSASAFMVGGGFGGGMGGGMWGGGMYPAAYCPYPSGIADGAYPMSVEEERLERALEAAQAEKRKLQAEVRLEEKRWERHEKAIRDHLSPGAAQQVIDHMTSSPAKGWRNYDLSASQCTGWGGGRGSGPAAAMSGFGGGGRGGASGGVNPDMFRLGGSTDRRGGVGRGEPVHPEFCVRFQPPMQDDEGRWREHCDDEGINCNTWWVFVAENGQVSPHLCHNEYFQQSGSAQTALACQKALSNTDGHKIARNLADKQSQLSNVSATIEELKHNAEIARIETEALCDQGKCPRPRRRSGGGGGGGSVSPWIGPVMAAIGGYLGYRGAKYTANVNAELGWPTPPHLAASIGYPFLMAGLHGALGGGMHGAFGCGPTGGGYGGGMHGGAFGYPPWMMGMPPGGGIFMPGMFPGDPWGAGVGLAGGFGLAMGMPMGMAMGMPGMAGGMAMGMPMGMAIGAGGAFGMPMGMAMGMPGMAGGMAMGMPMGMAIGAGGAFGMAMGMPGMAGGMAMGMPMGMAIGGGGAFGMAMGMPGMAGGMAMGMAGMPGMAGGMAMGMAGMPGMAGMAGGMGMAMGGMQFQQQMMEMYMQQMQMQMQLQQRMAAEYSQRMSAVSRLQQELWRIQMQIQQISMGGMYGGGGFDFGMGIPGAGGGVPGPGSPGLPGGGGGGNRGRGPQAEQ